MHVKKVHIFNMYLFSTNLWIYKSAVVTILKKTSQMCFRFRASVTSVGSRNLGPRKKKRHVGTPCKRELCWALDPMFRTIFHSKNWSNLRLAWRENVQKPMQPAVFQLLFQEPKTAVNKGPTSSVIMTGKKPWKPWMIPSKCGQFLGVEFKLSLIEPPCSHLRQPWSLLPRRIWRLH